jgi:hypothetical protein
MEYLLVAFMLTNEGTYSVETMAEYRTIKECEASLARAVKNGTTKVTPLVCAKRDWN